MNQESIDHFSQRLLLLPESLQPDVAAVFDGLHCHLPSPMADDPDWVGVLPAVLLYSPFIGGLLRREPAYLTELIQNKSLFRPLETEKLFTALRASLATTGNEQEIMQHLRYARNQAMLQIAFRDLSGWASLDEVMLSLSKTATVIISLTQSRTFELTAARFGIPIDTESGDPQEMLILGMGKLGGGELNFSSDVDLIFCFPHNGQTSGKRPLSHQEFFTKQAKLFIKLLSTVTADGFVYRVDTRLRPHGDSGPLCLSFSALEHYYQTHGRDWERYAFIKARIVAGDRKNESPLLTSLRPFIYRKYLDFSAIESIRDMKEKIERELLRKHEMQRNIKLGPGGIREVEFIAQAHQLIRGGRNPQLQKQSLMIVLDRLLDSSLISPDEFKILKEGYRFLRKCENRLQIYADQQTHVLPVETKQQLILALAMGYDDWHSFSARLLQYMLNIKDIFHALFISTAEPESLTPTRHLAYLWGNEFEQEAACRLLAENHYKNPQALSERLKLFHSSALYNSLSTSARNRLDRLLPVLLYEVGHVTSTLPNKIPVDTDETIYRCFDLLAAIVRRPVYLSLLLDNEGIRHQLIRLTAASPYVSILIQRYPILLDDLLTGYKIEDFSPEVLLTRLEKLLQTTEVEDLEQQMSRLSEFHHSKLLAVAALDISDNLSAAQTGHALSAIAEACTRESLRLSIYGIASNHGSLHNNRLEDTPFCVIAYGKLGSRELGFGSDLDLVFLSSSEDDSVRTPGPRKVYAAQFFARIGQRLVHIMSTRTPAGRLYEIDMRLRPSGDSGPLVTSLIRLQRYLREKAWTWEQQALIRARVIAGQPQLAEAFNALRKEVICRQRNAARLKNEVTDMREKMRRAKNTADSELFDLKQGHGGIVDIEFMVQYMVLRWAKEFPQLIEHTETLALLRALRDLELIDQKTHRLLSGAFSHWLEKSYRLKLNNRPAMISTPAADPLSRQVTEIWNQLLTD